MAFVLLVFSILTAVKIKTDKNAIEKRVSTQRLNNDRRRNTMKNHNGKKWRFKRLLVSTLLILSMLSGYVAAQETETDGSGTVEASTAETTNPQVTEESPEKDLTYSQEDYMSKDQYAALGFSGLSDPAVFSEADTTNPMEGYQPQILSELFVGQMPIDGTPYKGNMKILENGKTFDDTFKENGGFSLGGTLVELKNYNSQENGREYQTSSTVPIKLGDLSQSVNIKDSVVVNALYKDRSNNDRDTQLITLYTVDDNNQFVQQWSDYTFLLGDAHYVPDIEVEQSKCYTAMTVGDFDGDNYNEVAVYVPKDKDGGGEIAILEQRVVDGEIVGFTSGSTIKLSSIKNHYANQDGRKRAIVNLTTTNMAGRDDLAISVCMPNDGDAKFCNDGGLHIYSWQNGQPKEVFQDNLEGEPFNNEKNSRMQSPATSMIDLNGDGVKELVVAGNKNYNYDNASNSKNRGKISKTENMINVILWDGANYVKAWDKAKHVACLDYHDEYYMTAPVALAGADGGSGKGEAIFLEGAIFRFADGSGTEANEAIKNGRFTHNGDDKDFNQGGTDRYIYDVVAASFLSDNVMQEQFIVLFGNANASNMDKLDLNAYAAQETDGKIESWTHLTRLFNSEDEDDHGTNFSICPVDVDNDSVYTRYTGKTVGWSNPSVHSVMLSAPYWSELDYGNTMTARGSTSYSVKVGSTDSDSISGNLGLGFGVGLKMDCTTFGNGGKLGFSLDIGANYIVNYQDAYTHDETLTFTSGGGQDSVALVVTPLSIYHYDVWVPEHTATQEDVDLDKAVNGEASTLQVGDTVPGTTSNYDVTVQLNPAASTTPVSTYNQIVKGFNSTAAEADKLMEINIDELYNDSRVQGDPSTYASDIHQINSLDPNDEDTQLANTASSVGLNGKANTGTSISVTESSSLSNGYSFSLKAGSSQSVQVGIDLLFIRQTDELTASESISGAFGQTFTHSDSLGMTYSGTPSSLPDSAQTGTSDTGAAISSYTFQTSLVKWNPNNYDGEGELTDLNGNTIMKNATNVIGYIVEGADSAPPAIHPTFYVASTTDTAAALKWNPVTSTTNRLPGSYKIYYSKSASGPFTPVNVNGEDLVVNSDKNACVVTGLNPSTTYYFKLQAYKEADAKGTASILGPTAQGKTLGDSYRPTITKQPTRLFIQAGQPAELSVEARPQYPEDSLTYQWQKLNTTVYDAQWTDIQDDAARQPAFNAAYFTDDGLVNQAVINDLNNTIYRCAVTEHRSGSQDYAVVYSRSASLYDSETEKESVTNISLGSENINQETQKTNGDYYDYYTADEENGEYVISPKTDEEGQLTVRGTVADQEVNLDNQELTFRLFKDGAAVGEPQTVKTENQSAYLTYTGLEPGKYAITAVHPKEGNLSASADYAKFEVIDKYTITYNMNGGTCSNPTEVTSSGGVITLEPASRSGYTFTGWFYDEACTQPVPDGQIDCAALTADLNLYAGWTVNTMTVNYELDGGANDPDNPGSYTIEDRIVLKDAIRTGYTFEGWYTSNDWSNPEFDKNPVTTLPDARIDDGATLYAKWSAPVNYSITYVLDGGANNSANPASYNVTNDDIVFAEPAKDGYTFGGWYKDAAFIQSVTGIPKGSAGDMTVYAKWIDPAEIPEIPDDDKDGVYELSTYEDLVNVAKAVQLSSVYASASYELTGNINCDGKEWTQPIGTETAPFQGSFDGRDYYIAALRVDQADNYQGLFGVVGEKGMVSNLSVVDMDWNTPGQNAGGIAGINYGTITASGSGFNLHSGASIPINGVQVPISSLNSDITAMEYAGGVTAVNRGTVTDSRSNAAVSGNVSGGIAGNNTGSIANVYNTGNITGNTVAGGIAGQNSGDITSGYSCGLSIKGAALGGVIGENSGKLSDFFYVEGTPKACGNQEDTEFTDVLPMTARDMQTQSFCDTLNAGIAGKAWRPWTWDASQNEGYPRIERAVVQEQVLSNAMTGVSVSGRIHPDAKLSVTRIQKDSDEWAALAEKAGEGRVLKAWKAALVYADGTEASYEGDLKIQISNKFRIKGKDLALLRVNNDGEKWFEIVQNNGGLETTVDSLGNIALVQRQETTAGQPGTTGQQETQLNGGTGASTGIVGVDAKIMLAVLLVFAAICGGVKLYKNRKEKGN